MQHAIHQKMPPRGPATELWHVGIVHQPIATLMSPGALNEARITWLPEQGSFRFIADPFGVWRNGKLTVFVEALDYRTKRGEIHYYTYDDSWNVMAKGVALRTPYHLSYPSIIEHDGEIYMLPEAHKSGKLTLYRATRFPDQWEPVSILLDAPAIDAGVVRYQDRWWMFYSLPGSDHRALRELHIAYADNLLGPWLPHEGNPVRDNSHSARSGGAPFIHETKLYIPTQDCNGGYGRAINLMRVDRLTKESCEITPVHRLTPDNLRDGYTDGLHTLSACGDVTLIDVKRIDYSPARRWINVERRMRRMLRLS